MLRVGPKSRLNLPSLHQFLHQAISRSALKLQQDNWQQQDPPRMCFQSCAKYNTQSCPPTLLDRFATLAREATAHCAQFIACTSDKFSLRQIQHECHIVRIVLTPGKQSDAQQQSNPVCDSAEVSRKTIFNVRRISRIIDSLLVF